MKKHFILKSILTAAGLVTILTANAAIFFKSASMAPETCNTSTDWCIDVRCDNSIKPDTTYVNGQGVGITNSGSKPILYSTSLENNPSSFYDGIWFTQASVTKYQVKSVKFSLVSVATDEGRYPLSNCTVQRTFVDYKLGTPGVTHMVVSKTGPGLYQCHTEQ